MRSLLIPGSGQRLTGYQTKGNIFTTLQLTSIFAVGLFSVSASDADDNLEKMITDLDKVTLTQQTAFMRRKGILKGERTADGLVFSIANPKTLKAFILMREVVIDKIKKDSELLSVVTR